jgi:inner membrane protein
MMGSTHAIIGFMTGAAVAVHFHIPSAGPLAGVLAVAVVGSLAPDIDHPGSTISRRVKLLALPFRLLSHRGLTHSLLGIFLVTLLIGALHVDLLHGAAFISGYASHLIADGMTRAGIRLWYPSKRRFTFVPQMLTLDTGSSFEYLIALSSLIASVVLLTYK